jgi:hypothetical protein
MMPLLPWQGQHDEPDPAREAEKVRIAARQLEHAEDYIVAAINIELDDPEQRHALHELRRDVLTVREFLVRPRRVG